MGLYGIPHRAARRLFILTLLIGTVSVGGRFLVDVELSSATPKPEAELDVTCNFNLTHAETEQLVFYDLNSQTICFFLIRDGTRQCTTRYNSSVISTHYDSSEEGKASLRLRLQPCTDLRGVRCAVTDVAATERSGTGNFVIQNIPQPTITCVGDCEDSTTTDGKRTLRLDTNSTQGLTCAVTGAVPEVSFTLSGPYTVNTTTSTRDTDTCTFNQTVTAVPTADISDDTGVTCTVTGPGGLTESETVTIAVGPESPIETTTEESATGTTTGMPNNAVPDSHARTIGLAVGIPLVVAVLAAVGVAIWYFRYRKTAVDPKPAPGSKSETKDVRPGEDPNAGPGAKGEKPGVDNNAGLRV